MLKLRQNRVLVATGAGILCALLFGITFLVTQSGKWRWQGTSDSQPQVQSRRSNNSAVLPLVSLPPAQRLRQLQAIAQSFQSLDSVRARFLLASDLIQQKQGAKALSWLVGLEQNYPVLAPYVALRRAQAYELMGDKTKASSAWQELLKHYPKQPVAAQALFTLGVSSPQYWQQAIAQFPSHPRTLEIAHNLLQQNPHQPHLLVLLAKYAYDQPETISLLNQLVSQSTIQLKPADWEAIGFAYWENQVYAKAGAAYAQAPRTSLNLYRKARGFQLGKKRLEAIAAYQQLVRDFPNAKETGLGLMHLAQMSQTNNALIALNQVISQFPQQAGAALVEKAKILEALKKQKSAAEALQLLLAKYSDSDAAAEYRWKIAQAKAATGDYQGACLWAQPIPRHNLKSVLAPRASFWLGRWKSQLGQQQDAIAAFKYVLTKFPQSYYAWRAATTLGLDVGKFTNVGQLTPQVEMPTERPLLLTGSAALKELYQLGQDRDAWNLWQAESQNRMQPTVAEQFTDGLMRLMIGEKQRGISQITSLEDRETPREQAQYQAIRQQSFYWQALYPLPFFKEVTTWSQQRQLNPLLVTALIRQESEFNPEIRSAAGALGLMQMLPATAKWVAGKTHLQQYNLENPNDNIQLGTWFLDYTLQEYDNDSMLAVASYNAGTTNVTNWLKQMGKSDPDVFVEAIPFPETRNYVRQVFGNYWNYLRLYNPQASQMLVSYSAHK
ncbi:MAG: transglycosylase SLT domain-containing protein [Chroococcidiopsidaceae cyanobacterium CP_BM_RX_35]|nr:transglycosylase SLT domain-containing protein [Chroococcidiopsidaceae cyanobacterium CP_BM_RX_35]